MTWIGWKYRHIRKKLPTVSYEFFLSTTDRAEYRSEAAVVLDFVAQDESAQHVVATFPTDAFSGDRTDREGEMSIVSNHSSATSTLIVYLAPAAISLHRDDGSLPRIIAVSLPDISDERADEQGENIH